MFEFELVEAALPVVTAIGTYKARRLLPERAKETIRSIRYDRKILRLPDRRFIVDELAPWLGARGASNVLFVGCRSYTRHYPELFAGHGVTLWTTDIDPAAERFGAPGRHVTCDATRLTAAMFATSFDAIVFSGVIGFGVNSDAQIGQAADALAGLLRPGAPLILGWNTDRSPDPMLNPAWAGAFRRTTEDGLSDRIAFTGCTHVFDYLERA